MTAFPEGALDVATADGAHAAAERLSSARELAVDVEAEARRPQTAPGPSSH